MKHTPTPFEVRHSDAAGETLLVLPSGRQRQGRMIARVQHMMNEQRRADAEFIATACNNHDALIDVLDRVMSATNPIDAMAARADARKLLKAIAK